MFFLFLDYLLLLLLLILSISFSHYYVYLYKRWNIRKYCTVFFLSPSLYLNLYLYISLSTFLSPYPPLPLSSPISSVSLPHHLQHCNKKQGMPVYMSHHFNASRFSLIRSPSPISANFGITKDER